MASGAKTWLGTRDRYARLRRIEQLDPKTDYLEISSLFYGDFLSVMIALPYAGFMTTYASPRMSRILSKTGELEHRFAKRAVDTSLFAKIVHTYGFGTGEGREAARKVNALHSRYPIDQEDFILVGCDPALFSLDMAERYGWRPVSEKEKVALRLFYNNQARAFGARQNLPATIPEMRAFVAEYFDRQLWFEPQNERMAQVALDWYSNLAPRPLRPILRRLFPTLLDARVRAACGLAEPGPVTRAMTAAVMRLLARKDPVADGAPDQLEPLVRQVYPHGWTLSDLGPRANPAPETVDGRDAQPV